MNNRTLVNLGLLVLVALLGAVAFYEPGLEKQDKALPPLTRLHPSEIHSIRLSRAGKPEIVLEKQDGAWQMIEPRRGKANEEKIGQLLGIAMTKSHSHFPLPKERLSEFGLDSPSIQLQLNELKMGFGDSEPLQFRRYVRIGDQLHLISNGFHHHLTASANDYLKPK
jgi:hypothetical protein